MFKHVFGKRFPVTTGVGFLLLCMLGCSGQKLPDGMPKLFPCNITVLMDGTPLADASVTLVPFEGSAVTYSAGGTTNASGAVAIMVNGQFTGAPAGKYNVLVVKTFLKYEPGFEPENIKITPSGDEVQDRKTRLYAAQDHATNVNVVDVAYSTQQNSPLQVEVLEKKNHFKLEVKASPLSQ